MSESSTGKDKRAAATASMRAPEREIAGTLEVRALAPRTILRIITIEIEGDALAVSMQLGSILAHVLRPAGADEREQREEREEREGDGR